MHYEVLLFGNLMSKTKVFYLMLTKTMIYLEKKVWIMFNKEIK